MNNTMPEEQIEFIENISNYMKASNNMSTGEAYHFAFKVWQNERFFKELFGYNKAIDDFVCYAKHEAGIERINSLDDYDRIAEMLKAGASN